MRFLQNQGYRTDGNSYEKNNAKMMVPKNRKMVPKVRIDPWPSKGRLLGRLGTFLGESKKSVFFNVALGVEKVGQNRALGAQGTILAHGLLRKCRIFGQEGPRGRLARAY